MVALLDRGLLSQIEVVEGLLHEFCDLIETHETVTLFNSLPTAFRSAFRTRLMELKTDDFKWKPLMIGVGYDETGLARLSVQLAKLYGEICTDT